MAEKGYDFAFSSTTVGIFYFLGNLLCLAGAKIFRLLDRSESSMTLETRMERVTMHLSV